MSNLRILPSLSLILLVLFAVKAIEIWTGFEAITSARAGASAKAESHAAPTKTKADDHGPAPAPHSETLHGDPAKSQSDQITRHKIPGETEVVSAAEVEVLQSLAKRREALEARETELDLKENLLSAAEERIDKKILELKALETEIKTALNTLDEEEESQIRSLVKVYETMKPKDAAPILQTLDRQILIDVAKRMKEAKMAAILAKMDPSAAQEITVLLATQRERAGVGMVSGG